MIRIYLEEESCGWESVLGRVNSMVCFKDYIRVCEYRELILLKCFWIIVVGDEVGSIFIIFYLII